MKRPKRKILTVDQYVILTQELGFRPKTVIFWGPSKAQKMIDMARRIVAMPALQL